MRVECPHCSKKSFIRSRNRLSSQVVDLYCQCSNVESCGASFVFTLAYKHDLNPPQQTTLQLAAALLHHLPKDQLRALQADVFS